MAKKRRSFLFWLRAFLVAFGVLFMIICLLAFTTLPFWAYYRLGTSESLQAETPATIVLMSGAGMPSESSLIRAYYTSRLAQEFPKAKVIIAVPGDVANSGSDPALMRKELNLRGIVSDRILFAPKGSNTRSQAQEIESMSGINKNASLLLVTAPEHMRRAVLAFRKCGFRQVGGQPTFEHSLETDLRFDDKLLKGNPMMPPIGNKIQLRYEFWTQLKYEVLVIREYFALAYYKLRGWI